MLEKVLAHYEIESLLGKGGMGEVYCARDTRLCHPGCCGPGCGSYWHGRRRVDIETAETPVARRRRHARREPRSRPTG
jgi:hypothetical protein